VSGSGNMQFCTSLQTDNHTSTPQFFTGRMPFLPPNQQYQSTEGQLHFFINKKVRVKSADIG